MKSKHFVNMLYLIVFFIFIFSCWSYSFGVFDMFFMEYVENKRYDLGDFTYTGNIIEGKFQNKGIITVKNRAQYVGEFDKGKFDGFFTYSDNDNFRIYGVFVDDNIVGGVINIPEGKISIIENNEIIYKRNDGCEYRGNFGANGQYGLGKFTYKDGSKYEGNFFKGLANKEGVYSSAGVCYEGSFLNGLFNGFGKYRSNSVEYVGEFVDGLPNGRGEYMSKYGWKYEGNFKNGVFNGEGVVMLKDGRKINGVWNEGQRVM